MASSTQLRKNKAFSFKQYEVLSKNSYSFYGKIMIVEKSATRRTKGKTQLTKKRLRQN
ncbi:hypothetical protein K5E_13210 [Enterococcus thailandicus]|uniref:Uncharacterized protein n=1 Tax=Enterococcus thailandicus TaxID=417368 RepID=A0A510WFC1_ENTTH|nr:hypothetical protein RV17_GL000617 [Enterococcus thailandicus]GEK37261.1 hypothetical protein ETH01_15480 [Enterococcus thailandicus]GMC02613.1 hypothetical protein K4E_01240 [Enterococcus thailandicus]GMC09182.1 hypothetical protein K5E_13210 [Enterococcus thailandicus]